MPAPSKLILARWEYRAAADGTAVVLPDGCRDLVLVQAQGQRPRAFLTELDGGPRSVTIAAGSMLAGIRLLPGARVDQSALGAMRLEDVFDLVTGQESPEALLARDLRLDEALQALAVERGPIGTVARRLGVSERTLHRLVLAGTGRSPKWWHRLARARSAAAALRGIDAAGGSLAEAACLHGFADQAHLSREVKHWFGMTPQTIARGRGAAPLLAEAGFASPQHQAAGSGAVHSSTK